MANFFLLPGDVACNALGPDGRKRPVIQLKPEEEDT